MVHGTWSEIKQKGGSEARPKAGWAGGKLEPRMKQPEAESFKLRNEEMLNILNMLKIEEMLNILNMLKK